MTRAEALHDEARAKNGSGHPAQGARAVRRALELIEAAPASLAAPERDALAHAHTRLLITLAFSEFELFGMDRGRQRLEDARLAAEGHVSDDVSALLHELQGLLLVRSGDLPGSLLELDSAVRLVDALDPPDQAALLLNRGSVNLLRGALASARADLSRSADLAAAHALPRVEFKARHNLGYAEFLAGNLPRALDILARADALDADVTRSVWFIDRARVLMEAGLVQEADESLANASRLLRGERAHQDRAEAELARAECALLQDDWDQALAYARRARAVFRRRQSTGWQARADLTRWQAQLASRSGAARVAREIALAGRAYGAAADAGAGADRAQVSLLEAEAHLVLGDVDHAVRVLDALRRPGPGDPLSARLHHHLVRAGVARAAGDTGAARRELRTGLTTLARQQARHHSLDLRSAMAVHGVRLAELDVRIGVEAQSPRSLFDSLERWRAMSHRRTAVTPPADDELADLVSQLRIVSEDVRNAPPGANTERHRRRQQSLQRAVREREWRLQGDGSSQRPARLADLRAPLKERHTDAVCYFVLDEQLSAVTVVAGRCAVRPLGPWAPVAALVARVRADLDALAGRLLPERLRAAITSSLAHDLTRLDAALLPPDVADSVGLLVVPSRTLATVPWGMLPRRRQRPTTVTLSATGWLRGLGEPVAHPSVVAVAGPGLPLAGGEVRAVAAAWPGATAIGWRDATATSLAAAIGAHDLVHIAAHGTHNQDNPLFSSLRLADGPLFAYDIPQDAAIASHVVLSACDLGLATPRPGGEVLGLTAALLGLGARCVVSTVARVDDTAAYEAMVRYHQLLASGLDSAEALALADAGNPQRPAPFVCVGSPWSALAEVPTRSMRADRTSSHVR